MINLAEAKQCCRGKRKTNAYIQVIPLKKLPATPSRRERGQ